MMRFTAAAIAIAALVAGTVSAEACNPLVNKNYVFSDGPRGRTRLGRLQSVPA